MASNRLAIFPQLPVLALSDSSIELQFARDYGFGEITFTDKIRHDKDFLDRLRIKKESGIAQARLFFPKGALHGVEEIPIANLSCVEVRRRARIRIDR